MYSEISDVMFVILNACRRDYIDVSKDVMISGCFSKPHGLKVKFTLEEATKAQRWCRCLALLFR